MDDVINPMIAGALVGAMSEFPVFLRSKVITKADLVAMQQVIMAKWIQPFNDILICFNETEIRCNQHT